MAGPPRWFLGSLALSLLVVACGPSAEEIQRTMDQRIAIALTAIPTPSPIVFPTPLPTSTPIPTPSPIVFPTPLPTSTPIPTATPVTFPPTPTPMPTATPIPTATPVLIADFHAVYERSWQSVFYIETTRGSGTGWLSEPGLILTAYHVVGANSTVTIRRGVGQPFTGRVVAFDSQRDIALISFDDSIAKVSSGGIIPLPLGNISGQDIARPLLSLGYSNSGVKADGSVGSASAVTGVLSQITNVGVGATINNLLMDVAVGPGDSGGPVLNELGFVVGMTRAISLEHVGTSYAISVDEIRAALPDLRIGKSR